MRNLNARSLNFLDLRNDLRESCSRSKPPSIARAANAERREKNLSGSAERIASRVSTAAGGETGEPSTTTTWQPTESLGADCASLTASSKRRPIRHQRGRRDDASIARFDDCPVDTNRQTEIIGIHDQSSHPESVAAGK